MASNRHEYEFLPAALEVQETPPSPLGRSIVWSLVLLVCIAIGWAMVGEVDIVATAQGKIIPSGRDKVVQPLEIGVVRHIHVQDGLRVEQGDLLIELDSTSSDADKARMESELMTARLDGVRLQALASLDFESGEAAYDIQGFSGFETIAPQRVVLQRQLLQAQIEEYRAQLAALHSQIRQHKAEYATTERIIEKLRATLPLIAERTVAVKGLAEKNLAARQSYLELEQQRLAQQHDLATYEARLEELTAAIAKAQQEKKALLAKIKSEALTQLANVERNASALQEELRKADQRNRLQHLTAPVSGVVHQLDVHTVGAVVTPAQPLLVIVPEDKPLEIEAWIANKDIGFVEQGQDTEIKIEAFPFTKYGVINGEIINLSSDAITNEQLGLVYRAKVLLKESSINIGSKRVNLAPGMAVTVEIKTGKRRLMEYLLSPVLQYVNESVRER